MKPNNLIIHFGALLIKPIQAWTIPDNLEDGLSTVEFPSDGSEAVIAKRTAGHIKQDLTSEYLGDLPPKNITEQDLIATYLKDHKILHEELLYIGQDELPDHRPKFITPYRDPPDLEQMDPILEIVDNDWEDDVPMPVSKQECVWSSPRFPKNEYLEARANLFDYCSRWYVPEHTAHIAVAKAGNVVAYVCNNRPDRRNVCSQREFEWVEHHWLDPTCGELKSGWVDVRRWGGKARKGGKRYGRALAGVQICDKHEDLDRHFWIGKAPEWDRDHPPPKWYIGVEGDKWHVEDDETVWMHDPEPKNPPGDSVKVEEGRHEETEEEKERKQKEKEEQWAKMKEEQEAKKKKKQEEEERRKEEEEEKRKREEEEEKKKKEGEEKKRKEEEEKEKEKEKGGDNGS